jgi:hypothetical protein
VYNPLQERFCARFIRQLSLFIYNGRNLKLPHLSLHPFLEKSLIRSCNISNVSLLVSVIIVLRMFTCQNSLSKLCHETSFLSDTLISKRWRRRESKLKLRIRKLKVLKQFIISKTDETIHKVHVTTFLPLRKSQ